MTPITDEALAAIKAGLEGVTPGPWSQPVYSYRYTVLTGPSNDRREVCETWSRMDAAHIARMDPTTVASMIARIEAAEARVKRLEEALTPSGATKATYIGEFKFGFSVRDSNGDEIDFSPNVPWTTIKEIMAAIRARAALEEK